MKLTREQANYIRGKESFQEGLVGNIFGRLLKSKLKKNPKFQQAVDKADKSAKEFADSLRKLEKMGVEIPKELKQYARM